MEVFGIASFEVNVPDVVLNDDILKDCATFETVPFGLTSRN